MKHFMNIRVSNRMVRKYLRCYHKIGNKEIQYFDPLKIRNVGIIAHIDAGKTTTTERMLYLSGATKVLGNVDSGNTVTDYMDQERERGISITSAIATLHWNDHKINLIDTPGHVDFTSEVQCSLSAIDGAIVILDASAGVEAQTIQVWRQADFYKIPKIVYLNKMDKTSASVTKCLQSLREKLNCTPLLVQTPIFTNGLYHGVVDLVSMKKYVWNIHDKKCDAKNYIAGNANENYEQDRSKILDLLAEQDDVFAEKYILNSELNLTSEEILSTIARLTNLCQIVPIFLGSSFKNIGIQPLISGIVSILPSPCLNLKILDHPDINKSRNTNKQIENYSINKAENLEVLVFKTIHDHKKPMFLCRILKGELKIGLGLFNKRTGHKEVVSEMSCINGDELQGIKMARSGDIVVICGPKKISTGDFLTDSLENNDSVRPNSNYLRLDICIPDPVYFCSIETGTLGEQKYLEEALVCLQREDPSLKVRVDAATGQTILGGMGELHLEVIKERIKREYKLNVDLGPLQIAYLESILDSHRISHSLEKNISGSKNSIFIEATVSPVDANLKKYEILTIKPNPESELLKNGLKPYFKKAIDDGIATAMSRGSLLGHPVINVSIELNEFVIGRGTSLPMISSCVTQCITKAFSLCSPYLLQPVMNVEIEAPMIYSSSIFSDLMNRGSEPPICQPYSLDMVSITTTAPLSRLQNFATSLRMKTSGLATFTMRIHRYEKVGSVELARIISTSKI